MATTFHVGRDQSEAATPRAVAGQNVTEGGIVAIRDTGAAGDEDRAQYCFYVLIVGVTGARGNYEGTWQVQNLARDTVRAPSVALQHAVAAAQAAIALIPASGASTSTPSYISLGNNVGPSVAQIIAALNSAALNTVRARMTPLSGRGATSMAGVRALIAMGVHMEQEL